MKILIINAGESFGHSGGELNGTITKNSVEFCNEHGFEHRITHVIEGYEALQEVENILWADVILYHTPIWWFSVPYSFKHYIDTVLSSSSGRLYGSDGRSKEDMKHGYGTGGKLHGKRYMLTTTWNAPKEAFTEPNEFFEGRSVDEGVMLGFHKMNAFMGITPIDSMHFYDVSKAPNVERDMKAYRKHLENKFADLNG